MTGQLQFSPVCHKDSDCTNPVQKCCPRQDHGGIPACVNPIPGELNFAFKTHGRKCLKRSKILSEGLLK